MLGISHLLACSRRLPSINISRLYSQAKIVAGLSIDEVVSKIDDKDVYLVDVRRPEEVSQGTIEADKWVHVPWQEVGEAALLSSDEFKDKYGCEKPKKSDNVVFYCLGGVRSTLALKALEKAECGIDATHFPGGWDEWTSKKL